MGYKNVCFNCRKAFNIGTDYDNFRTGNCPDCGGELIFYDQRFRPPKKDDLKQWEVVKFLRKHGFVFQHIYKYSKDEPKRCTGIVVKYPTSFGEAKEFVEVYKSQAVKIEFE